MAHKIALLNLVTAKELDPILAIFINTRFEAFSARTQGSTWSRRPTRPAASWKTPKSPRANYNATIKTLTK